MSNFFLLYRPFHFTYCKLIIEKFFEKDENILINHFSGTQNTAVEGGSTIIIVGKGALRGIRKLQLSKHKMAKAAESGDVVNIFIPHTLGILSNYAYHRLTKEYKNVKIHIFYEGIIVFYNYEHLIMKNFRYFLSRMFIGFLCGFRYQIEQRLLNLYDPRVQNIFTPFINLEAPKEKLIKVDLRSISYHPVYSTCVILGQDLGSALNEDLKQIIEAMYRKVQDYRIEKIYFKPHPSEKNSLFEDIASAKGIILHKIHSPLPIEEIVEDYKPGYVFSIWSSAMANLKSVLPLQVKIISFVTSKLAQNTEHQKILNRFEELKIELVFA